MADPVQGNEGAEADHESGTANNADGQFGKLLPVIARQGIAGIVLKRRSGLLLFFRRHVGDLDEHQGSHAYGDECQGRSSAHAENMDKRHGQHGPEHMAGIPSDGK